MNANGKNSIAANGGYVNGGLMMPWSFRVGEYSSWVKPSLSKMVIAPRR